MGVDETKSIAPARARENPILQSLPGGLHSPGEVETTPGVTCRPGSKAQELIERDLRGGMCGRKGRAECPNSEREKYYARVSSHDNGKDCGNLPHGLYFSNFLSALFPLWNMRSTRKLVHYIGNHHAEPAQFS